jgi:hypothetical protein
MPPSQHDPPLLQVEPLLKQAHCWFVQSPEQQSFGDWHVCPAPKQQMFV